MKKMGQTPENHVLPTLKQNGAGRRPRVGAAPSSHHFARSLNICAFFPSDHFVWQLKQKKSN